MKPDHRVDWVTINRAHAMMRADGSYLSKHYLRSLVDKGVIPHLPAGNRKLIRYSVACEIIRQLERKGGGTA